MDRVRDEGIVMRRLFISSERHRPLGRYYFLFLRVGCASTRRLRGAISYRSREKRTALCFTYPILVCTGLKWLSVMRPRWVPLSSRPSDGGCTACVHVTRVYIMTRSMYSVWTQVYTGTRGRTSSRVETKQISLRINIARRRRPAAVGVL